jgi:hypothetical protein
MVVVMAFVIVSASSHVKNITSGALLKNLQKKFSLKLSAGSQKMVKASD